MTILRRGQYLLLTGLTAQGFVSLSRRGQVPLLGEWREGQEVGSRAGYLDTEALMMLVSERLACEGKISRDLAAKLVADGPECVVEGLRLVDTAADPVWIAYSEECVDDAENSSVLWTSAFGTLDQIARAIAAEEGRLSVLSMVWVNLSECVQTMRNRAKKHGIDLAGHRE